MGAPVMALPMARKKEFEGRMLAILDPAIRRASPGRLQAAVVIGDARRAVAHRRGGIAGHRHAGGSSGWAAGRVDRARSALRSSRAESQHAGTAGTTGAATVGRDARQRRHYRPTPSPSIHADTAFDSARRSKTVASLDQIVAAATNGLIKAVGGALSQAGAQLARQGHIQAADTGRVALMIKILATDSDASVRRTAAWGLHDVESADVRTALITALHSDADEHVREMAAWALGEQGNAAVTSALSDALLHDKSPHVRATSAWALGEMDAKSEISALESAHGRLRAAGSRDGDLGARPVGSRHRAEAAHERADR